MGGAPARTATRHCSTDGELRRRSTKLLLEVGKRFEQDMPGDGEAARVNLVQRISRGVPKTLRDWVVEGNHVTSGNPASQERKMVVFYGDAIVDEHVPVSQPLRRGPN